MPQFALRDVRAEARRQATASRFLCGHQNDPKHLSRILAGQAVDSEPIGRLLG
jgi:hypothetical protein